MRLLWLLSVLPGLLTGATVGCSESTGSSNVEENDGPGRLAAQDATHRVDGAVGP